MEDKKVYIELKVETTLSELDKLFNEDATDEEFEEWVEYDLSPLNVGTIIDYLGFKSSQKCSVTAVYIGDEND